MTKIKLSIVKMKKIYFIFHIIILIFRVKKILLSQAFKFFTVVSVEIHSQHYPTNETMFFVIIIEVSLAHNY